jgi:hypothetical protein
MEEKQNAYKALFERAEGPKIFCRPRNRWQDNVKIYFKEIVLEVVNYNLPNRYLITVLTLDAIAFILGATDNVVKML